MARKTPWLIAGPILLAGCASILPPGLDHPANPDSPVANAQSFAGTLAVDATSTSIQPTPMTDPHAGHDMMGHKGHAMPGAKAPTDSKGLYWCPMDPEVVQEGPGKCPICGMKLKPKPAEMEMKGGMKHDH